MLSRHKQGAPARNRGGVRGGREQGERLVSQILYSLRVVFTCILKTEVLFLSQLARNAID